MRHLIVALAASLAFLTIVMCVFGGVSFSTMMMRAAVVGGVALVVGFIVVSIWVAFSLVGTRKEAPPAGQTIPTSQSTDKSPGR
ncbi:MAG: hypothetical protein QHJ34_03730 [bacterium]|jgi:hypothetical protein|nr:hypothetical protein [candidate division KSB1 bacterium]MDH7559325.1 hypothetical protein [bacterium]